MRVTSLRSFAVAVILLMAGCGMSPVTDYGDLELLEVTGRVTLDGVVLGNARVEFESEDMTTSYAVTDERGEYRLMFNSEKPGCVPGEKTVRIRIAPAEDNAEDPDADDMSGIMIPAIYNTESTLRATVTPNQRTFDFDLSTSGGRAEG